MAFSGFGGNQQGFGGFGNSGGFGSTAQTSPAGGGFGSATQPGGFGMNVGGFGGQGGFDSTAQVQSGFGQSPPPFGATGGFGTQPATSAFGSNASPQQSGFGGGFGGAQPFGGPQPYTSELLGHEVLPPPGVTLIHDLAWNLSSSGFCVVQHSQSVNTYVVNETVTGINASGIAEKQLAAMQKSTLQCEEPAVTASYLTDALIAVGTANGKMITYNAETGVKLKDFPTCSKATQGPVLDIRRLTHELLITGTMDGVITLWRYAADGTVTEISNISMAPNALRAFCIFTSTKVPNVLALSGDGQIHVFLIANNMLTHGGSLRPPASMKFPIECMAEDQNTLQLFVGSIAGRCSIMKLEENSMTRALQLSPHANLTFGWTLHRHQEGKEAKAIFPVLCAAFTLKNRVITSGGDGTLTTWDIAMRKSMWQYNDGKALPLPIRRFSLSPNEAYLLVGCCEAPLSLIAKAGNALTSRVLLLSTPAIVSS